MPAVRKPTALHEATGSHPERLLNRKDEPNTGRGIGPAPESFSEIQRAAWDEIVANCAGGVFQSSDRVMMESLACLLAEYREDRIAFGSRKLSLMLNMLARCGMTPSDRSKVVVSRGQEEKKKTGLASFR